MKRSLISAFIAAYIGVLTYGNCCHALQYQTGWHPLMYLIVWDMFCGWSAYATETALVAEGESGKYYELGPGPWGHFQPWGADLDRHSYDHYYLHEHMMALNTLRHTRHERIGRVFIVEQVWAKKYDLPDHIWRMRYGDEPKDPYRYCNIRREMSPDGSCLRNYPGWVSREYMRQLAANPRLQTQMQRSRPLFVIQQEAKTGAQPVSEMEDQTRSPYPDGGFQGVNVGTPN
jgi:hypothetical protein